MYRVLPVTFMVFLGAFILHPVPVVAADDPLSGEAVFADVVKYASFSPHRTATEGDVATSQWLERELKEAGYETELQSWGLRQFFPEKTELNVGGKPVESFPFWYPKATGDAPVKGRLVEYGRKVELEAYKGAIVYVSARKAGGAIYGSGVNKWAEQFAKAGAVGLVMGVSIGSKELPAINARDPYHQQPLPLPSVIVSRKDEKAVAVAAKEGLEASITIQGKDDKQAVAYNVVGRINRGDKWVVVTTPTSGWFTCAGERGPGVALFLALARWAAKADSPYSFLFLGNSGHELDNTGAHHTLDKYAPPVDDVALWIHLGASIGTRLWKKGPDGPQPLNEVNKGLNLVGTKELVPVLEAAFAGVAGYKPRSEGRVAGELRHFIKAGYQAFGFFAGHYFFHTKQDTPATTEPAFLEPVARALAEVVTEISKQK